MKAATISAPDVPAGATLARSKGWRSHAPWLVLLLLAILPSHVHLLIGDKGAISRDYGMLFLDALTQQHAALADGHLLLWDPSQVGGTAFWPLPNQAPLYPPLMVSLLLRGPIGGLNLSLFLHVLWGALGTYALVYRLGRRRLAALVGGVLFANAYFTRHLTDILPLEALACSWIPWAAYGLCRAQDCARWLRWTAVAALAYAAVAWLGGFIQFLPGLVVLGTILLVAALRRPSRAVFVRAGLSLAIFVGIMTLVSAGKLLPMWHWISLTDRSGGIDEKFALGGSLQPAEVWQWTLNEGWSPLMLALCGLVLGLRKRSSWTLPFLAAVAVLMLIASGPLYKLLFHYAPGFKYVREPRRVWLLMPGVLPVAAGLGLAHLQDTLRLTGRVAVAAGALLLAGVAADAIVWPRYAPPDRQSLSERLDANAIHKDLARRAAEEPRFRVIDIAKARARVKQTADLMRSSFGLEGMEGILGNVSIQAYDNDYLNIVRSAKAKLLGIMNCRYVTSSTELHEPGLTFVQGFTPDSQRPFPGIDGPFLYRNDLALPRASLADHALLQVGGDADQQAELLRKALWDPLHTVLVRAEPEDFARLTAVDLKRFDAALICVDGQEALRARLTAQGVSCFVLPGSNPVDLLKWLAQVLAPSTTPLRALDDPPREWNGAHLSLPADAGPRWLLLAETYAIYPGWAATIDGQPAPMFRANAVTTALMLPPGAHEVAFRYTPPGLVPGLALTLLGLLLAAVAVRWPARAHAA